MFDYKLKERMQKGETVYGLFINSGSTIAVEVAGLAGFDFVMIDSEHGPTTSALENRDLIAAAEVRGCTPLVRIPNGASDTVLKTLDVGAHGIMVPQVNDVEKAEGIASAARYFPEGTRGVATHRASDYGFCAPYSTYFPLANARNLVIAQCENVKCLPHLDEITAVAGIDVIFIGPYDLSCSMGKPGSVAYSEIKDVVSQVLDACKKHGKIAGIFTKDAADAKMYSDMGFRFIIVGTDIGHLVAGTKNAVAAIKANQ